MTIRNGTSPARRVDLELIGDWSLRVTVHGDPGPVHATLEVPRPTRVEVCEERYEDLQAFDPQAGGWKRGTPLSGVRACECTVKDALDPKSLVVRDPAGNIMYEQGRDFAADLAWGTVGRLPGGRIAAGQPVCMSYTYVRRRLDSVLLTADGDIALRAGAPQVAMCEAPPLAGGETRLANVFVAGLLSALTPDNLFPILETAYPEPPPAVPTIAEARLPRTVAKLRAGELLRILAWGDSVTAYRRWQTLFVDRLRTRFPRARIELVTEAWGGRNTGSYLAEPAGSEHNYQEKVLDRRPDLVVSEFVNDASLQPAEVAARYGKLLADFRALGAEWIILTPHYVLPDWMGLTRQREIDEDPRPYVAGLRQFAAKHGVALADASLRYGRLWRQGIPYLTLMENNINHPNPFGHALFADSLMALFPRT